MPLPVRSISRNSANIKTGRKAGILLARDEGIEPPLKVLETSVLPLYESRKKALEALIWFPYDEYASCNACNIFPFPSELSKASYSCVKNS